ncbi:MAG: hypothetical protein LBO69_01320, partial [Ignavibacteria bacterium]|nr:hypothetical protein [Ignavibacteria bacterium]
MNSQLTATNSQVIATNSQVIATNSQVIATNSQVIAMFIQLIKDTIILIQGIVKIKPTTYLLKQRRERYYIGRASVGAALIGALADGNGHSPIITLDCSNDTNIKPIEKQLVCEAWKYKGLDESADCKEIKRIVYDELQQKIQNAGYRNQIGFNNDCSTAWCAFFVARVLVDTYEALNIDISKLYKALDSFLGNVENLIKYLVNNGIAEHCITPKVGSIFYRKSYVGGNNHTGIVVKIDANKEFWTIEGNAKGENGFGKFGKNKWLKATDLSKCEFEEVKCENECGCEGGGCDCDTLQSKLNELRNDIDRASKERYEVLIKKLEGLPTSENSKDLLSQLIALLKEIDKGVYVALSDNSLTENKTTEILLLLAELRDIIRNMKYCNEPELTAEITDLINEITEELHQKRDTKLSDKYDNTIKNAPLENMLDRPLFAIQEPSMSEPAVVEEDWYDATINRLLNAIDKARDAFNNCTCEDVNSPTGTIINNNNYYDNEDSNEQATACPTCDISEKVYEKITDKITNNVHETIENNTQIIKETPADYPDYSDRFNELKGLIAQIKQGEIIVRESDGTQDYNEKLDSILDLLGKLNMNKVECKGEQCPEMPDYSDKFSELKALISSIKQGEINVKCEGGNCPDYAEHFERLFGEINELKQTQESTTKEIKEYITLQSSEFVKEFEKVIEKVECKECDNSAIIN